MQATCICNIGTIRSNNEDNLLFNGQNLPVENFGIDESLYMESETVNGHVFFGVFDGMGGEEDGQIASYLASEVLKTYILEKKSDGISMPDAYNKLIHMMNEAVYKEAEKRFNQMGCTAAMLCVDNDIVHLCNVGDSRIYRMREAKLEQISVDHTDKEMLIKYGITTRKPRLTQCVGVSPEEMMIEPYIVSEPFLKGDTYLLCSDGLTDMVPDDKIQNILAEEHDLKRCTELLMHLALQNGGRDNITILMVLCK